MGGQSCNVFHRHREVVALRKLLLRSAFLELLPRAEWDDTSETTFWSLAAFNGVAPRGYISWTTKVRMKVFCSPELTFFPHYEDPRRSC